MKLWQRNLTVSWITQIISLTGFNFVLPFLPYYIQELGVKSTVELNTWVGLISSAPALLMGIMAPIWGFLADKLGRKLMILRAMLGGSIIISLMGVARNVETVFILRCLQGLFTGSITASATLIAAGTPDDKLSFSLGFLSSSNFIGLSIGPLIGGLLAEFLGFRTTIFSGAALIFVGFLMVLFFIREAEATPSKTMPKPEHFSVKHIMRQPFIFIFTIVFLLRFSRMLPIPFIPLYIQELQGTMKGASALTGLISAGRGVAAAVAGLTLARLGDRYDRRRLISILLIIAGGISLPMFWTRGLPLFTLFFVFSSYFFGGVEPTLQSFMSTHTPPQSRGIIFGIQTSVGSLGWFLAPLFGSGLSIFLGTKTVFLFYSVSIFLAFAVTWVYRGAGFQKKI